jgi:acetyl-CoA C-acetyltransferase
VIDALLDRTGADPAAVEDVIFGCVSQAGEQSTNVARNAVLSSRLPEEVPGTSLDRQCGSSQQALHFAAQAVMSGTMDVVIAGGVESMTRVPMGMPAFLPQKNGLGQYRGSAIEERYAGQEFSQFIGAEMVAEKYGLSKDVLDEYGYTSQVKAARAAQAGAFDEEIVPLPITTADGAQEMHQVDEGIRFETSLDAIKQVKLLREGGRITAATASQICDGASAIMIVNERGLKSLGLNRWRASTTSASWAAIRSSCSTPLCRRRSARWRRPACVSTTSTSSRSTRRSRQFRSAGCR